MKDKLTVWTSQPELMHGAGFIVVAPGHTLDCEENYGKDGDTRIPNLVAINPFNNEEIPIYIGDSVNFPEFNDIYIGFPGHSKLDEEFAKRKKLPVKKVVECNEEVDKLVNSGDLTGLDIKTARSKICDQAKSMGVGGYWNSSKMKDWLVSRQRGWGTPIPFIHCDKCGVNPVPYEDLPVELPTNQIYSKDGTSPLAKNTDWLYTSCPK